MRAVAATAVMTVALSALVGAGQKTPLPPVPDDTPIVAKVNDISNHPGQFYGRTVRVVQDVARVLAPRIFTLDEDSILGTGKDVMVVAPSGTRVREDDDVEVIGKVSEFTWQQLEKERFDFDLKPEWQVEFKTRPVIYATSVRVTKTH